MTSEHHAHHGPGFATPADAMRAPREEVVYVAALHTGTGVEEPDFLATVDVDPSSEIYGSIVARTPMPGVGDELHHYGWQTCSSAFDCCELERRYLIVPGLRSSRVHIVDVATTRAPPPPQGDRARGAQGQDRPAAPHTVHCMPGNNVVMSMLGDADGNDGAGSPSWTPRPSRSRAAGRPTGPRGGTTIPLEIRWLHRPDADEGHVGAALSSTMWHVRRGPDGRFTATKVISSPTRDLEGFPVPMPGLIIDLVISISATRPGRCSGAASTWAACSRRRPTPTAPG